MSYQKHQLYLDDYDISGGVVKLPDKCNWIVMKHIGSRSFVYPEEKAGGITLILNEDRTPTSGFWSVMSFLTREEAEALKTQLETVLGL